MKFTIDWVYKTKQKKRLIFSSEEVDVTSILTFIEDIEGTGRVHEVKMIDKDGRQWSKKELKKFLKQLEDEPTDIVLYFDGGFNRDEQDAGLGVVLYYKQNGKNHRIRKNEYRTNIETNNESEYAALELAVLTLIELGGYGQEITIKGDSKVIINEMKGEWPSLVDGHRRYGDRIDEYLKKQILTVQYEEITRNENDEAHQLAAQALQGINVESKKEV